MRGREMQDGASNGRLAILHRVAEIVAQRRQQYGSPAAHFEQVARRWSLTVGTSVRPEQVLLCQLDLKLVRLAHDPGHRDSLVDLIGYTLLLHELVSDVAAAGPPEAAGVAEAADPERCPAVAAAEVLLKSAEAGKRAGRRDHGVLNASPEDGA
jgi:Domain of unknown function (DUF6378)